MLLSARAVVEVVGFTYDVFDEPPAEEGGKGGNIAGRCKVVRTVPVSLSPSYLETRLLSLSLSLSVRSGLCCCCCCCVVVVVVVTGTRASASTAMCMVAPGVSVDGVLTAFVVLALVWFDCCEWSWRVSSSTSFALHQNLCPSLHAVLWHSFPPFLHLWHFANSRGYVSHLPHITRREEG